MIGVFVNGVPMNAWPIRKHVHLRDLTEAEDVEYEEIETTDYEESKRDN